MQVVVNNLLTNFSEAGTGKRIMLFLHGWGDSESSFTALARDLTDHTDYRAVLLDLPGFGGTQAPSKPWGLDDYANFVAAFIAKKNLKPEVIVGHSNGGAIAIKGIAHNTLSAEKLVLIGSAGIRNPSLRKKALQMVSIPAKLALKVAPKSTQRKIRGRLYSAIGSDYLIAEHLQETFKKVVSTDIRDDAAQLRLPVLLIYGENDTATPPEYGQLLHELIPESRLQLIPLAGHFVHQEQEPKVSSLIKSFVGIS